MDEDCTTFLGKCLNIPAVKKITVLFLHLNGIYISLCRFPLSLALCITVKMHPCHEFTKISQNLPTSGLNSLSCLSLSSCVRCSKPLISFVGFFWTLAQGSPDLDPALQSHLTRANKRERVTSLSVLTVLFLMHSRILLAFFSSGAHCQLIPTWYLPKPPGLFLPGYFLIVWL